MRKDPIIAPTILERVKAENGRRGRIAPCEQSVINKLELLCEVERADPGGLYSAMGTLAQEDYWFYLRVILDYRWMEPWFHGEEVFRFLEYLDQEGKDGLLLMFRGSGKSGLITAPMPAWKLAQNPELLTMLCNYSEAKAHKFARASANIISKNMLFKRCFPDLIPSSIWGDNGYVLESNRGGLTNVERLDPNLIGYGTKGNVTGSHVNGLVILDDLISKNIARSKAELKKVEEFFGEIINTIDPGVPLRMCMTRWHYDDFLGKIETGELEGRNGKIEVFKVGATRKRKRQDGKVVEEITFPRQSWYDDHGNAYQVGMTFENLEAFKRNLKGLFPALYYNTPVLDEDCIFSLEALRRYKNVNELPFELGPVAKVVVECEAQGASLIDTFTRIMRDEGKRFNLEKVHTRGQEKIQRIMDVLQTPVADGQFHMREQSYQSEDGLLNEMRSFPKGHDDQLDAHSYCYEACQRTPQNSEFAYVCIAVDPAYTEESYSDYTAIAVGCIYQGEYYELDTIRFQTQRTDLIVRMVFTAFNKFDKLAYKRDEKARKPRMAGYSSSRARTRNGRLRRQKGAGDSFEVDMSEIAVNKSGSNGE